MLPITVGIVLAVIIAAVARWTKFDHDRSYYPLVLIVIASYYVLFACIANEAVIPELLVAAGFTLVAIAGALRWPVLVGVGILLHGGFDLLHDSVIVNSGVPPWWPIFCATIDVLLGCWVIYFAKKNEQETLA